ncbi:hypothetical protein Tco_0116517 [Tanacetum coccineum]
MGDRHLCPYNASNGAALMMVPRSLDEGLNPVVITQARTRSGLASFLSTQASAPRSPFLDDIVSHSRSSLSFLPTSLPQYIQSFWANTTAPSSRSCVEMAKNSEPDGESDIRLRFDRGIPELTGYGNGGGESPII